ncbi:MAG: TolC family protein [Saprospiraceae bacterium]|nr:TolC family protein [Saprospiraceae bacterium]
MKSRLFIPILLLSLVSGSLLQAQSTGKKWTLSEAVAYGIENNISVQQSQLQVTSSQSTYRQSRESRLPNVNGNGTQTLRTGRSIDPFTNQLREQSINSTSFGLDASVTLWNGFRINNTIKQNELNYQAHSLM